MPAVNIPDETYRKLSERASKAKVPVEELVAPALEKLAATGEAQPPTDALSYEEWKKRFDAWQELVKARAGDGPTISVSDDRESIYREREDAQL